MAINRFIKHLPIFLLLYFGGYLFCSFDNDGYFLIATGREILQNGFSYTHPFSINHEMYYVVQQWLYTIYMAWLDSIGLGAMIISVALIAILLGVALRKILMMRNDFLASSPSLLLSLIIALICLNHNYMLNIRPEAISVFLILCQFLCLEYYKKNHQLKTLFFLFPIFLLEANLHMSMILLHITFFIPYFLKLPQKILNFFNLKDNHIPLNKKILCILLLSSLTSFINPYGLDGIAYLYNSLTANTFDYVRITEVRKMTLISFHGLCFIFLLVFLWVLTKKGKVNSDTFLFVLGINFMYALALRNNMFIIISMMFLISEINYEQLPFNKKLKRLPLYLIIIFLASCSNLYSLYNKVDFNSYMGISHIEITAPINCVRYLNENESKNTHILTGFNWGGFLEYYGYKNILIDARPELYMSKLNKTNESPLVEYSELVASGEKLMEEGKEKIIPPSTTVTNTKEFLNKYKFDYILLDKSIELPMNIYLGMSDDWQLVASDKNIYLFKRK